MESPLDKTTSFILTLTLLITAYSLIASTLLIIPLLLAKKSYLAREKLSPYETGFSPISKSRQPFSLRFFIITILFLIFDVEIVLLLPLITAKPLISPIIIVTIFIFILVLGLIHEWKKGLISWL